MERIIMIIMAAGALLGTLPTILIYLALQKYFVKGTLDSAVK